MNVIIGLGANLGEREANLERAIALIGERLGGITDRSKFYRTAPLVRPGENADQVPEYLNAALSIETELSADRMLGELLRIERELGRDRSQETGRWQSRLIDLDLLAYGNEKIATPSLTVPHPEMHKRRFVLEPLRDVAPNWRHPVFGKTAGELLEECDG